MSDTKKNIELEQELREIKAKLRERELDLSSSQKEIVKLNGEVCKILSGLDKNLSMIKKVFKYLVPTQFPHISGFQFSTKFISGVRFSGDYIDVFEQKDKLKFNLILSCSNGPGLTALLIAFLLRHGRDLGGSGTPSPKHFVEKVLDEIQAKNESLTDIQLACLLIDKRSYNLSYKLHGHVNCYHQSGKTQEIVDLSKDNNREGLIKLNAADRLLVISPGLIGATNTKGQVFSTRPILEAMKKVPVSESVHNLRNEIFYKLDRHLGERKPMQDVSIIIMSVDKSIIRLA